MAELPNEDDLLHHHSLNVEYLLKDTELSHESRLNGTAGLIGTRNIWSSCPGSSSDFLCDYQTSLHWPSYTKSMVNGSPSKDLPMSSPESDAGSDNSWRCDSGVNGFDVGKWTGMNGGTNGIYDPFRSSSVIDDLDGVHVSEALREKSPLRRSQSANSRPTFADVAKKPSSPGSEPPPTPSLSNDEPVYGSEESLNSLHERKVKQKAFRPAHPRHGGYHVPLPINPDSKYGLDDFEVQESSCGKMERSFSCNDAIDSASQGGGHDLDHFDEDEVAGGDKQFGSKSSNGKRKREWFDPKRIFINGSARTRSESVPSETILNNNTSARTQQGAKGNERRGNAPYINNLHDSRASKQTNSDRAKPGMNGNGTASRPPPTVDVSAAEVEGGVDQDTGETSAAGYYLSGSVRLGKGLVMELVGYLILALMFIVGLTSQTVYFVAHHTSVIVTTTFTYLAVKVGLNSGSPKDFSYNSFTKNSDLYGCDENIQLPETSEEAMRRLLTCQGKDPYSILGLRFEASDEQIRRYFRRQAVLVHPDKNKQPGAEEAFKILGQAFELIGTPEKRSVYDQKIESEKWSEEMRMHTEDLLQKMKEKFEEASRWIQCNKCEKKHRRYLIDRPVYSARKCSRCQCYHAAKEGEIWAETTFMGFKWHFYACMQNTIYDVTDWVVCQGLENSIQPNSHTVHVKINSTSGASPSSRSDYGLGGAADMENLENLIKTLFPQQQSPFSPDKAASPHPDSHTPKSTPASSKKGKRRSKRR